MPSTTAYLDAEGRLDLAAIGAPFGPGDMVEFYIAAGRLILKESSASMGRGGNDRETGRPDLSANTPRR